MPALLLARGDSQSRDLLRMAIEARYGFRPPVFNTLDLALEGRVYTAISGIKMWLPIRIHGALKLPHAVRWEYSIGPYSISLRSGTQVFDGETQKAVVSESDTDRVAEPQIATSLRRRNWAVAALLLAPLSEYYVELSQRGVSAFNATNTETGDCAALFMNEDNALTHVETTCYNPETRREEAYNIAVSSEQVAFGDLILPAKMTTRWNDQTEVEVRPKQAILNPQLAEETFKLTE